MMLNLFLTACLLVPALSEIALSSNLCDSCIDNHCYNEKLSNGQRYIIGIPAFDTTENIIYYSRQRTSVYIQITEDMGTRTAKEVPGVSYFARGHTVDQKTRQVYIWTEHDDEHTNYPFLTNKTYRYDPVTNTTVQLDVTSEAIKEMHFKEKLYYTLKFRNGIFEYYNGTSNSISAFYGYNATQFIVDKLEDIYATTETGVYRLKKDAAQVARFTDKKYSVSVDKDENMYFLDPVLKKVLKLDYVSDKIVDAGVISSDATDRLIFDKHNNMFVKSRDMYDDGEACWLYFVHRGLCPSFYNNNIYNFYSFNKVMKL